MRKLVILSFFPFPSCLPNTYPPSQHEILYYVIGFSLPFDYIIIVIIINYYVAFRSGQEVGGGGGSLWTFFNAVTFCKSSRDQTDTRIFRWRKCSNYFYLCRRRSYVVWQGRGWGKYKKGNWMRMGKYTEGKVCLLLCFAFCRTY